MLVAVRSGAADGKDCAGRTDRTDGGTESDFNINGNPAIILIAGLGSGKTTFGGKLANYPQTKRQISLTGGSCRYLPPAAIDQLEALGGQIDVPVYSERENKDAVSSPRTRWGSPL